MFSIQYKKDWVTQAGSSWEHFKSYKSVRLKIGNYLNKWMSGTCKLKLTVLVQTPQQDDIHICT